MRKASCIMLLTALAALSTAGADTLIIEGLNQAQATAVERPSRGMSMNGVAAKWGSPVAKDAAVGQPPITRWEYSNFVVFFEYDHVLHAVTKRQ
jgi:hypothetical protein